MRLGNKKAFVTGASRGIGKAIPMAYANAGADIAITAHRTESQEETTREIESRGHRACPLAWDLRDVSQVDDRLAEVRESLGGLGIVVKQCRRASSERRQSTPEPGVLLGLYYGHQSQSRVLRKPGSSEADERTGKRHHHQPGFGCRDASGSQPLVK